MGKTVEQQKAEVFFLILGVLILGAALISFSVYFSTLPKFKVGDCIEFDSKTESWENNSKTVEKILIVGQKKYKVIDARGYVDSDYFSLTDNVFHTVQCPTELQDVK